MTGDDELPPITDDLKGIIPSISRLMKGPVVIVECVQQIPCNPCIDACVRGHAITKKSLVDPPVVDHDRCTGCGECVALCPGLAIFVLNLRYKRDEALLMIPYEQKPVPKKGEIYEALDRSGKRVGEAEIVGVREMKDRTRVVSISVKRRDAMIVREIGRKVA